MLRSKILILEQEDAHVAAFHKAIASLGSDFGVICWHDAPSMISQCADFFCDACLISLSYDLANRSSSNGYTGSGLDIAGYLSRFTKACPVILHSLDTDHIWVIQKQLQSAGWVVDRVVPAGEDWIARHWLPKARWLIEKTRSDPVSHDRSPAHAERMSRALLSLSGLSVGDSFGASFKDGKQRKTVGVDAVPEPPWKVTENTIMAISLVETLNRCGEVNPDILAQALAERYRLDPRHGYGQVTGAVLREISNGVPWSLAAARPFDGLGSMGNSAAVRVPPLGAYFADQLDRLVEQATQSARVTQSHFEGEAGAIAVALAAAWSALHSRKLTLGSGLEMLAFCAENTPEGATKAGLVRARTLSFGAPIDLAARALGNGSQHTAPDTVPFALWCAAKHLGDYAQALSVTVRGMGDRDANAAIVGGIVILSTGLAGLPQDWLRAREPLPLVD